MSQVGERKVVAVEVLNYPAVNGWTAVDMKNGWNKVFAFA
jgi:hypothetical protein